MRQLERTATVHPNKDVGNAWHVSAGGGEPGIVATFIGGDPEAVDGFSSKALAIEYARMKFSQVTVEEAAAPAAEPKSTIYLESRAVDTAIEAVMLLGIEGPRDDKGLRCILPELHGPRSAIIVAKHIFRALAEISGHPIKLPFNSPKLEEAPAAAKDASYQPSPHDRLMGAAKAAIAHWDVFGPENGFDEDMQRLARAIGGMDPDWGAVFAREEPRDLRPGSDPSHDNCESALRRETPIADDPPQGGES